ncbi:MAG: putative sugar O-methyltransferase [Thalassobaculaceae bacterium]|nr:putative sugar O-methyltransferase [Thalassobaculaceae bacterium]
MKDAEISELFRCLLEEAGRHLDQGWRPVGGENGKIDGTLDSDFIRSVRDYYSGGFGHDPRDYFPGAASAKELLAQGTSSRGRRFTDSVVDTDALGRSLLQSRAYVEQFNGRYLSLFDRLCVDPEEMGGPRGRIETVRDDRGPVPLSWASISVALRIVSLVHTLQKYKPFHRVGSTGRFIEIGGGFGHLLSGLARVHTGGQLLAVDLPANLAVTHFYLERMYPGRVGRFWFDGDTIDPAHRVATVAPWKLKDLPVADTIVVNFRSFQHMDLANHRFYSDVLKAIGCQAIYHVNRDFVRDPGDLLLDQYPFREWCQLMSRTLAPFEFNHVVQNDRQTDLYLYEELLVRDATDD